MIELKSVEITLPFLSLVSINKLFLSISFSKSLLTACVIIDVATVRDFFSAYIISSGVTFLLIYIKDKLIDIINNIIIIIIFCFFDFLFFNLNFIILFLFFR